jgi:hypothetical protein
MKAADLDGDGDQDLALVSSGLRVFWNRGSSTFRTAILDSRERIFSMLVADLDGRNGLDVAAGTVGDDGSVIFLHQGEERFASGPEIAVFARRVLLAAMDADGDGDQDLVVGEGSGLGAIQFLLNDGAAAFVEGGSFALAGSPRAARVADFNGDGLEDLVVSFQISSCFGFGCTTQGGASVFLSTGIGKLRHAGVGHTRFESESFEAADLDVDGDLDLALPQTSLIDFDVILGGQSVEVFLNEGDGGFSAGPSVPSGSGPSAVAADDFDGDGLPDLATASASLSIVYSRLDGGDSNGDGVPDECAGALFRRADADASGAIDLTDAVHLLLHLFRGGAEPPCAKAADANDDGRVDLSDPVSLLDHLFRGGPAPPPPHEACGLDPTPDELGCEAHAPCA